MTLVPRRSSRRLIAVVGLILISSAIAFGPAAVAQTATLDNVFSDSDPVDGFPRIDPVDYWSHTWDFNDVAQVQPANTPPTLSADGTYYYWEGRATRFIRTRCFPKNAPPAHNDPDSRKDVNAAVEEVCGTLQAWLPGSQATTAGQSFSLEEQLTGIDQRMPVVVVAGGFFEEVLRAGGYSLNVGPTDAEAVHVGRYLASRGVIFVRWIQGDYIAPGTIDSDPTNGALQPLWMKCGYPNESSLASLSRDWVKMFGDGSPYGGGSGSDTSLSVSDLRLDYRFALAQGYVVAGTFVKELVKA